MRLKYYFKILKSLIFHKTIINPKKKQIFIFANQYNFDEKGNYKENLIKNIIRKKHPNKKIYFVLEPFSSIVVKKGYNIQTCNFYSLISLIMETIFSFSIRKIFWLKMIDKFDPTTIYGEHIDTNIIEHCIKKKIFCYEVQHGIIDEKSKYYKNFFQYIKLKQKDSFKKVGLIVWNNEHKKFFEEKYKKKFCKVEHNPDNIIKNKNEFDISKILKTKKKIVLITLQDRLDEIYRLHKEKNFLYKNLIPKFLIEAIKTNKNFLWIFKFHPRQIKKKNFFINSSNYLELNHLFKNEKNIILNYKLSKVNLAYLLKYSKFHVCDSSASSLLSSDLNIPTGVWNPMFKKKRNIEGWFKNSKKIYFLNKKNINSFLNQKN